MKKTEEYRKLSRELRRMAGWLDEDKTLCVRAADAIDALVAAVSDQAEVSVNQNSVRVETPAGALIARESGFGAEYPGIWVELRRQDADQDLTLCLVEYTETEGDLEDCGNIITRVWKDSMEDEYTDRIVHTGIEDFFKTE